MVTPHTMVAFAPIEQPRRNRVVSYRECRFTCERGLLTFVSTQLGPRNTSSSTTTPVYTETLFCILTLFPISTPPSTLTFCPITHFWPICAPFITCEKCQIFVPGPIFAPSSAYADS